MADGQPIERRVETHYSAAELAGVPGMPDTTQGVTLRAKREKWPRRNRSGRGGGREYPASCLPKETATELSRRAGISAAARIARNPEVARLQIAESVERAARWREVQRGMARYAGFTGAKKDRADARNDMVGALRTYAQTRQLGLYVAAEHFACDYNAGRIEVTEVARRVIGDAVSAVSLRRWNKAIREHSSAALAGDYGNRAGSGVIDSNRPLYELIVGLLASQPHLSAKLIYRAVTTRFGGTECPIPALRSLQRWLTAWKRDNAELFCALRNPDEWKNKYMVAFGSMDEGIERLNQRWEMDSTPADVMLTDGRHTIVQVCDVWPRRRMFLVHKSSSSEALCLLMRRALLDWGVPELVKKDNGQDYVSHRFRRVLHDLDIKEDTSAPFSPWEKPFVERGFRTMLHDLFEMLPGFIGHNVAERSAIEAKHAFADRLFKKNTVVEIKMDAASLQSFLDRWTASIYETEARDSLGGMTVQEKVASYTGTVRRIEDERVLDVLLAEAPDGHGQRVVGKKGLRIDKLAYVAPELADLVGQPVHVRYTEDVGRVVVFHDDVFVCVAECAEALGVSRQEVAIEAKARQRSATQAAKREVKAIARKLGIHEVVNEILDAREASAANVVPLPSAATTHQTEGTEAACAASAALDANVDALPPVTRDDIAYVTADKRAEQEHNQREETNFKRFLDLKLKPGDEWCETDKKFFVGFDDSPAMRTRWAIFETWGPKAMGLPDDPYLQLLPNGPEIELLFPINQPQGG